MPRIPVSTGMKDIIDLTNDNEDDDPSYFPPSEKLTSPRRERRFSATPKSRDSPKAKRTQTKIDSFVVSPLRPSKRVMTIDSFRSPSASANSPSKLKQTTLDIFNASGPSSFSSPTAVPGSRNLGGDFPGTFESSNSRYKGFNAEFLQIPWDGREAQSKAAIPYESSSSIVPSSSQHAERMKISSNSKLRPDGVDNVLPIPGSSQSISSGTGDSTYKVRQKDETQFCFSRTDEDMEGSRNKRTFSQMMRQDYDSIRQRDKSPSPDPIQSLQLSPRILGPNFKRIDTSKSPSKLIIENPPALRTTYSESSIGLSPKREVSINLRADRSSALHRTQFASSSKSSISIQTDISITSDDDGDPFEEYNPFDDTEEIAEIRRRKDCAVVAPPMSSEEAPPNIDSRNTKETVWALLASRNLGTFRRRPYLSLQGRAFLRHMGPWQGFSEYEGQLIHVDFTATEVDSLMMHIWDETARQKEITGQNLTYTAALELCIRGVLHDLPGRTEKDCFLFLEDWGQTYQKKEMEAQAGRRVKDHAYLKWLPENYITLEPAKIPGRGSSRQRLLLLRELGKGTDNYCAGTATSQLIRIDIADDIHPWKVFKEGSNDILDIAWSPDGRRFVLGAATHSDAYNRAGNLVLGSVPSSKVKFLHGHQELRPPPHGAGDPFRHCTVPAVAFAADGRLVFSGGYDKTVRTWDSTNGGQLYSLSVGGPVTSLAASQYHGYVIASGCSNGTLRLSTWNYTSSTMTTAICSPIKEQDDLYPAYLAWGEGPYSNNLVVAYDTQVEHGKRSNSGSLLVFDATTQQQLQRIIPGSTRHFDVCSQGQWLLAACSGRGAPGVRSHVRCYTQGTWRMKMELDSPQLDINRVTLSPCGTFATSSGTDGTTLCWDIRMPDRILTKLWQDRSLMEVTEDVGLEDDTGVEVALWGETSDRFYTGGSDGVVKIWDIKRADPFVRNLGRVDAQIMSGKFSPARDMLMIGDSSGTATLFSTMGNVDALPELFETEGAVIPDAADALEPGVDPATLSRDAAAELIRAGHMVIREGSHGLGAYGL